MKTAEPKDTREKPVLARMPEISIVAALASSERKGER
jgi:hypothetical protein